MAKIISIEGIGEVYGAKLMEVGIKRTEDLLASAADPKSRKELAAAIGVEPS
jgi:hypothetical protein